MVGKTARSKYKKKRSGKPFSGTQRHAAKGKKPAPADDFETQPSTSGVANRSDSDSEKPTGSSRKKMENTSKKLSVENSEDELSFQPEKSEGDRIIDLENLSKAVSSVHVCDEGEKFNSLVLSLSPYQISRYTFCRGTCFDFGS